MRFAPGEAPPACRRPASGRRARLQTLAIAALLLVPLIAGCQLSNSAGGGAGGTTLITVAAVRGADNVPLFIAARDHAFARAGLNVVIDPYPSVGQELQALSNGKVDMAVGDYVDFFSLMSQVKHPYLTIVADGYHAAPGVMEILTYPGSGITTPAGLAHRTVGTSEPQGIQISGTRPYSEETLAAQSVLVSDGVNPSNILWKPMPASALISALASRQVAAILVQEPQIFEAESQLGAVAVLDACSGATANLPLSGYFAQSSFVRGHKAALNAFRSVLIQAQTDAVLPGPVRAELAAQPGMSMQAADLVTIGGYPTTLNAASLQRVASLMFNFEMLPHGALDVSSMITP